MTSAFENRLSMYYKLREFFSNNLAALIATVPALAAIVTDFNAKLTAMEGLIGTADEITTGYTTQKYINYTAMRELGVSISAAVYAFAIQSNESQMAEKYYTTRSALDKKRDTDVLYWSERLAEYALANAAALVPLGVSPAMLSSYSDSIVAYRDLLQEPADMRSVGAGAFIKADKQKTLIEDKLKIMDALMVVASYNHSQLYYQYQGDRRIDDNSSGNNNTPPDVVQTIAANSTVSIFTISYYPQRSFKIRTTTNIPIEWGLSENDMQATHPLLPLAGNATSERLSINIAPSGEFLIVRNLTPDVASIELWVIEE